MTYTKGEFSEKHQQAIRLFESGLGYKRVATALQLAAEMKMSKRTILSWLTAEQAHEDWNAVGQIALRETSDVVHLATN